MIQTGFSWQRQELPLPSFEAGCDFLLSGISSQVAGLQDGDTLCLLRGLGDSKGSKNLCWRQRETLLTVVI